MNVASCDWILKESARQEAWVQLEGDRGLRDAQLNLDQFLHKADVLVDILMFIIDVNQYVLDILYTFRSGLLADVLIPCHHQEGRASQAWNKQIRRPVDLTWVFMLIVLSMLPFLNSNQRSHTQTHASGFVVIIAVWKVSKLIVWFPFYL